MANDILRALLATPTDLIASQAAPQVEGTAQAAADILAAKKAERLSTLRNAGALATGFEQAALGAERGAQIRALLDASQTGDPASQEYIQSQINALDTQRANLNTVGGLEQAYEKGPGGLARFAGEVLGGAPVNLLPQVAAAGVGKVLGGNAGAMLAGAGSGYQMNAGDVASQFYDDPRLRQQFYTNPDAIEQQIGTTALQNTAMDVGPGLIASRGLRDLGHAVKGAPTRGAFIEGALGGLAEGAPEMAQDFNTQTSIASTGGEAFAFDPWHMGESFLGGAIQGAPVAAAGSMVNDSVAAGALQAQEAAAKAKALAKQTGQDINTGASNLGTAASNLGTAASNLGTAAMNAAGDMILDGAQAIAGGTAAARTAAGNAALGAGIGAANKLQTWETAARKKAEELDATVGGQIATQAVDLIGNLTRMFGNDVKNAASKAAGFDLADPQNVLQRLTYLNTAAKQRKGLFDKNFIQRQAELEQDAFDRFVLANADNPAQQALLAAQLPEPAVRTLGEILWKADTVAKFAQDKGDTELAAKMASVLSGERPLLDPTGVTEKLVNVAFRDAMATAGLDAVAQIGSSIAEGVADVGAKATAMATQAGNVAAKGAGNALLGSKNPQGKSEQNLQSFGLADLESQMWGNLAEFEQDLRDLEGSGGDVPDAVVPNQEKLASTNDNPQVTFHPVPQYDELDNQVAAHYPPTEEEQIVENYRAAGAPIDSAIPKNRLGATAARRKAEAARRGKQTEFERRVLDGLKDTTVEPAGKYFENANIAIGKDFAPTASGKVGDTPGYELVVSLRAVKKAIDRIDAALTTVENAIQKARDAGRDPAPTDLDKKKRLERRLGYYTRSKDAHREAIYRFRKGDKDYASGLVALVRHSTPGAQNAYLETGRDNEKRAKDVNFKNAKTETGADIKVFYRTGDGKLKFKDFDTSSGIANTKLDADEKRVGGGYQQRFLTLLAEYMASDGTEGITINGKSFLKTTAVPGVQKEETVGGVTTLTDGNGKRITVPKGATIRRDDSGRATGFSQTDLSVVPGDTILYADNKKVGNDGKLRDDAVLLRWSDVFSDQAVAQHNRARDRALDTNTQDAVKRAFLRSQKAVDDDLRAVKKKTAAAANKASPRVDKFGQPRLPTKSENLADMEAAIEQLGRRYADMIGPDVAKAVREAVKEVMATDKLPMHEAAEKVLLRPRFEELRKSKRTRDTVANYLALTQRYKGLVKEKERNNVTALQYKLRPELDAMVHSELQEISKRAAEQDKKLGDEISQLNALMEQPGEDVPALQKQVDKLMEKRAAAEKRKVNSTDRTRLLLNLMEEFKKPIVQKTVSGRPGVDDMVERVSKLGAKPSMLLTTITNMLRELVDSDLPMPERVDGKLEKYLDDTPEADSFNDEYATARQADFDNAAIESLDERYTAFKEAGIPSLMSLAKRTRIAYTPADELQSVPEYVQALVADIREVKPKGLSAFDYDDIRRFEEDVTKIVRDKQDYAQRRADEAATARRRHESTYGVNPNPDHLTSLGRDTSATAPAKAAARNEAVQKATERMKLADTLLTETPTPRAERPSRIKTTESLVDAEFDAERGRVSRRIADLRAKQSELDSKFLGPKMFERLGPEQQSRRDELRAAIQNRLEEYNAKKQLSGLDAEWANRHTAHVKEMSRIPTIRSADTVLRNLERKNTYLDRQAAVLNKDPSNERQAHFVSMLTLEREALVARYRALKGPDDPAPAKKEVGTPTAKKPEAGLVRTRQNNLQAGGIDGEAAPVKYTEEQLREELTRIVGPRVALIMKRYGKDIGASGEYTEDIFRGELRRMVELALDATHPMEVIRHEALHAVFATLADTPEVRRMLGRINKQLRRPAVRHWIATRLVQHEVQHGKTMQEAATKVAAMMNKSDEELAAFAFQYWADSTEFRQLLKNKLPDDYPLIYRMFERVMQFVRDILGTVSEAQQVDKLFLALHSGALADPATASKKIQTAGGLTITDKAVNLVGEQAASYIARVFQTGTERVRAMNIPALNELMDEMYREVGEHGYGYDFMEDRARENGFWLTQLANAMNPFSSSELETALEDLKAMRAPTNEAGKKIRVLLDSLHGYVNSAPGAPPVAKIKNYFPRLWNQRAIAQRPAKFIELLVKHGGMDPTVAEQIVEDIQSGHGQIDLAENDHHMGYAPFLASAQKRQLTFIDESNAHEFSEFQYDDMQYILEQYIRAAVHRTEYSKRFGPEGEKITAAFEKARKQGATEDELREAARVVKSLEGTLAQNSLTPALSLAQSSLLTLVNTALLPLALVSQTIDPLALAARSGSLRDAGTAFVEGIKGIANGMSRSRVKSYHEDLAELIGVIQNDVAATSLGSAAMGMDRINRRINDKFFKLNGMQGFNNGLRIAAVRVGEKYLLTHHNSPTKLRELGLLPGDIMADKDTGQLVAVPFKGATQAQMDSIRRVQRALYRFVEQSVVHPNAAQQPVWMADPRWQLFAHMRRFSYAFDKVIMQHARSEMSKGNAKPFYTLMGAMPVVLAADMAKWATFGGDHTATWGFTDYLTHAVNRAGLHGRYGAWAEAMPGPELFDLNFGPSPEIAADLAQGNMDALNKLVPLGSVIKPVS